MRQGTTTKDYLIHGIFFFLYGMVKYFPAPLGNKLRYIVAKPFFKKLGKSKIGEGVTISFPYRISIGDGVRLNEYSFLAGYGGIEMHDGSALGNGAKLFSFEHELLDGDTPITETRMFPGKIVLEKNATVASNGIVLKGVTLGKGSFVGAGAIVTKDIPPNAIVAGASAKVIKYRE